MKRPKEEVFCSICPSLIKMDLKKEVRIINIESRNEKFEGELWFYQCPECGSEFTTTESDTISMENMNKIK